MADGVMTASTFLVRELRQARITAGLSQEELGKQMAYSGSLVSAVETGQRPPGHDYVTAFDRALKTGGLFERLLKDVVSLDRAPVWLRDWIIFEREATLLRWFQPLLVPGLLQTEAYARAVLEASGLLDATQIEEIVASRLDRQAILDRPSPPTLISIVDEGVLRREVGSPAVMAEQCAHLLTRAAQHHVHVHVVPASVGAYAGMAGPFILAKGDDLEAAHLDNALQAQAVDRRDALDRLVRRWESIRGQALPRALSIDLIRDVMTTWQS
ncbi:MAG TPA: helix-turn-helix transcriptional regulator [Actinoplanes sp.]|jgi:transcriptional regulator with XRE-family HTH domain